MYKILFIKNKINKLKINKYFTSWFESKTPLKFEVEYLDTDITTTSLKMSNESFSGVVCGDDLYDKLKAIIPEHKYHLVVFAHDLPLSGIRVNYTPYLPLYRHTDLIQLINLKDNGKSLNHEIFHALIHKAQRQGASFDDPMDKVVFNGKVEHYFKNSQPDAIPSNRSIALELLKGWYDKILKLNEETIPEVILKRIDDDGIQTLGQLFYKDFECKTLERPWKNNQKNISCIPKGEYLCKYTFSPKFLKYTYLLHGTGNRSGIRIHSGNFFFDIEGCILLGDSYKDINADKKVDILNSRLTVKKLEDLLDKKPFRLRII